MKKKLFITLALILLFTGCGKPETPNSQNTSNSIESSSSTVEETLKEENLPEEFTNASSDEVPSENEDEAFDIDINKCIDDLKDNLPLEPDYTFVNDYVILADGKDLTISIVVDDDTDPEKALDFADTVVRQLNLYANMQDSNVELGNKDFYGGLYTEYSALVGVAPYSKMNNTDEWFVYDAIVGGKVMLKLK